MPLVPDDDACLPLEAMGAILRIEAEVGIGPGSPGTCLRRPVDQVAASGCGARLGLRDGDDGIIAGDVTGVVVADDDADRERLGVVRPDVHAPVVARRSRRDVCRVDQADGKVGGDRAAVARLTKVTVALLMLPAPPELSLMVTDRPTVAVLMVDEAVAT